MGLEKPIEDYASTRTWASSLSEKWGGEPLVEEPEKLEVLAAFCAFADKDPDELVAFCFLRRKASGERFGSVKRREELVEQIRAFRAASGLSGTKARKLVSDVMSFLIHNGVLINPGMI